MMLPPTPIKEKDHNDELNLSLKPQLNIISMQLMHAEEHQQSAQVRPWHTSSEIADERVKLLFAPLSSPVSHFFHNKLAMRN